MGVEVFYETSVVEGLELYTSQELSHRFGDQIRLFYSPDRFPGTLQFVYGGSAHNLLQLKTVLSLFRVMRFPVPRPKALLGHQNLHMLLEQIDEIRRLWPKNAFHTVYLAAAGSDSGVMRRIAGEIATHTGLQVTREEGDLLVRIRRPLAGESGWEAATRMSPRPLSVRPWRECDWKGALNAAVAQVMAQISQPSSEDVFLNLTCGSGTLLIERVERAPARLAIGCDTDAIALECAKANLLASKQVRRVQLGRWDACTLPLADGCVDAICADLPFGHDVGSHQANLDLYPLLLNEAARVAHAGARCVLLTHELHLTDRLLEDALDWQVEQVLSISLAGLHPRIYVLRRSERSAMSLHE